MFDSTTDNGVVISLLEKAIDGKFLSKDTLSHEEIRLCQDEEWMNKAFAYPCPECGNQHATETQPPLCLKKHIKVQPEDQVEGFRLNQGFDFGEHIEVSDDIYVLEHTEVIDGSDIANGALVIARNQNQMEFSDPAGTTVYLPMDALISLSDEGETGDLMQEIKDRRQTVIQSERLDGGREFEDIIYRLLERDECYYNTVWGGEGSDQGKDAFCTIDLGDIETNVLVQAKFNNNRRSINPDDLSKYTRKANRHDCRGVLMAAIKVSGDLQSEFYSGSIQTNNVVHVDIWAGPDIKEKLAEQPDLISEYFVNRKTPS